MDKEENLKIIYKEVSDLHKYQQEGIDLVNNKSNWILVSDMVFLTILYQIPQKNFFIFVIIFLVTVSAILSLIIFKPKRFKNTAKISKQLEKKDEKREVFLESLIRKKKQAYTANALEKKKIDQLLLLAQYMLIIALILGLLIYVIIYVG